MHARERLVEEQDRGLQHQTAPELEQLLLSARKVLGLELLDRRQVQELEIAARAPGHLGPGGMRARQARHEHVLEDGHAAPQLRELKGARDAHPSVNVRRTAAHLLAAHQHAAGIRVEVAGQHVDQRGLAGTIWADEPNEVASATAKSTASLAMMPPNRLTRPTPRTSSAAWLTRRNPSAADRARRPAARRAAPPGGRIRATRG